MIPCSQLANLEEASILAMIDEVTIQRHLLQNQQFLCWLEKLFADLQLELTDDQILSIGTFCAYCFAVGWYQKNNRITIIYE